nr:immunoglobulin heavy chain junction region [Macaca mulatta]MOV55894.1 immunoglobulin heavy chain junction region [Macaca mulatta]MOV55964.1 immunoglobulin heavy chain junction region [Macaca mulatta]
CARWVFSAIGDYGLTSW